MVINFKRLFPILLCLITILTFSKFVLAADVCVADLVLQKNYLISDTEIDKTVCGRGNTHLQAVDDPGLCPSYNDYICCKDRDYLALQSDPVCAAGARVPVRSCLNNNQFCSDIEAGKIVDNQNFFEYCRIDTSKQFSNVEVGAKSKMIDEYCAEENTQIGVSIINQSNKTADRNACRNYSAYLCCATLGLFNHTFVSGDSCGFGDFSVNIESCVKPFNKPLCKMLDPHFDEVPVIVNTLPKSEAAIDAEISIEFSKKIKAGTGDLSIKNLTSNIVEEVIPVSEVSIKENILTVKPQSLKGISEYVVYFPAGFIKDYTGNDSSDLNEGDFYFKTDSTKPKVNALNPGNGSGYVPVDDLPLSLGFNEEVIKGEGDLTINNGDGSLFQTISINSSDVRLFKNNLSFKHNPFYKESTYYLSFGDNFVIDLAGNTSNALTEGNWTFRTELIPDDVTKIEFCLRDYTNRSNRVLVRETSNLINSSYCFSGRGQTVFRIPQNSSRNQSLAACNNFDFSELGCCTEIVGAGYTSSRNTYLSKRVHCVGDRKLFSSSLSACLPYNQDTNKSFCSFLKDLDK